MNFLDLLISRQTRFRRHTSKPTELSLNCPFCLERGFNEDHEFHLGVNTHTGEGHCFRCGWGSKKYALRAYLRKAGASTDDLDDEGACEEKPLPKPRLPKEYETLTVSDLGDPFSGRAYAYLIERGISDKQIASKRVGVALSGRYSNRVIFPVIFEKKLRGFVARDYTGSSQIRYLNSKGEKGLYNLQPKGQSTSGAVILSEGVFKALRIERATGTRSSAILGNTITEEQVQQLLHYKYGRVIFWPDKNAAGIRGFLKSADLLLDAGVEVLTVYPIPEVEADELPLPDIKRVYLNRVRPLDWALRTQVTLDLAFPA